MKFILLISVFIIGSNTFCQSDVNPLMAQGYLGYSRLNPHIKSKGFETVNAWEGVEVNFGGMNFAYHTGSIRQIDADSTVGNVTGSIYKIGFRMGPDNWNLGSNSFYSAGIKPYLQVSGSVAQLSNRPTKDKLYSAGLVFSPGVQVNFSHFYLNASYDAGLYLNTSFFGGNKEFNLARGYIGATTLTLGFENAFDLLAPAMFSLKGYDVAKEVYTKDNGVKYNYDKGYYYRERVTTTITSYSAGERNLALLRPFWGVGPTYSFHPQKDRQSQTSMKGVNLGFRFWYLMIDGFYETGEIGLKDETDKNDILKTYPQLRNYDFSSTVKANNMGFRVGLNLSKFFALQLNFIQDNASKFESAMKVPFVRLNAYYSMGITNFTSTPEYTYANGRGMLVDFQAKKGIVPSAENNADYLDMETQFSGFGGSLEVGCAFFKATWYKYKNNSIANHMQYTVGTNIPLGRVFHAMRARFLM